MRSGFAPVTTSAQRGYAISGRRFRPHAGQFREAGVRVSGGHRRRTASRVLEREGDARGAAQGRQQGVSVRRGLGLAGRRDRRRRRALPSLRRIGLAPARHRARRDRSRGAAGVPRAAPRGQQDRLPRVLGAPRCAPAAAITKRTRDTATRRTRTCTTATGFAAGPSLSPGLRRAVRTQPGVSRAVRRRRGEGAVVAEPPHSNQRKKAARIEKETAHDDVVGLQQGPACRSCRISRSAARWSSRRAGKRTGRAAPPGSVSRSSAICSTATSAATGRRRCRIS